MISKSLQLIVIDPADLLVHSLFGLLAKVSDGVTKMRRFYYA